jgi:hypothetical protein
LNYNFKTFEFFQNIASDAYFTDIQKPISSRIDRFVPEHSTI